MPLDPHLRDTLEQFRGMLRRLTVSARSANFERMVYLLDLALLELAAIGEPRPAKAADQVAGEAVEPCGGDEENALVPRAEVEADDPAAPEPWTEMMRLIASEEAAATTRH